MQRLGSIALFVFGVAALALAGWWLVREPTAASGGGGRPPYVLPVKLGQVTRDTLRPSLSVTGTVTSAQRSRLGFDVAGRVVELLVQEGDTVALGEALARLADADQTAELARARSAVALARSMLDREEAGSREETIRRLEAEYEVRVAEAKLAKRELERGRELVDSRVITASQLDALEAEDRAAAARLESASESLSEAKAGSRKEDIAVRRAELELRQTEERIADRELEKTRLVARFDGAVVERMASVGDVVDAGQPIFEVVDLGRREVRVEVPSRYASAVRPGATAIVTLDEEPGFRLETTVDTMLAAADEETRNFRATLRLEPDEDPERKLLPGRFARVELSLVAIEDALLVPLDAVRVMPDGDLVVAARESEGQLTAEWIRVRTVAADSDHAAVVPLDGELAPGDSVVVTGVDLAFPGAPLLPAGAGRGTGGGGSGPAARAPEPGSESEPPPAATESQS